MAIDKAEWHYGGDFPDDLPDAAGATHIGMYLAWALAGGHGSEEFTAECAEEIEPLLRRETTPGRFILEVCDEGLYDDMLSAELQAFTAAYYGGRDGGDYLTDLGEVFDQAPSVYHAPDDWSTYDRLAPRLAQRLDAWRGRGDEPRA